MCSWLSTRSTFVRCVVTNLLNGVFLFALLTRCCTFPNNRNTWSILCLFPCLCAFCFGIVFLHTKPLVAKCSKYVLVSRWIQEYIQGFSSLFMYSGKKGIFRLYMYRYIKMYTLWNCCKSTSMKHYIALLNTLSIYAAKHSGSWHLC